MKKILITAYSLGLGGIEKALINLLHLLPANQYDITLVLEKKEGIFLEQVPDSVKVIEYRVCDDKNVFVRKLKNRLHLLVWKVRHKNRYDFAISFATYSRPGAHIALNASSHNALWIHNDYCLLYEGDQYKMAEFFRGIQARKFQKLVFVSEENRNSLCKLFSEFEKKSIVCNNIIDYEAIREKALENTSLKKEKVTFLNVGRHEEHQKRLSRIIEASSKLVAEGYDFTVWFVGDGVDRAYYQQMVEKSHLTDTILFLGKQDNPFPYYKACDCVLLSSMYEGYPVVFIEAMTMNKPLVTTMVSDYQEVRDGFGIVVENSLDGVYRGMKEFLDHGYSCKKKFDPEKFNQNILEKLELLMGGSYEKRD